MRRPALWVGAIAVVGLLAGYVLWGQSDDQAPAAEAAHHAAVATPTASASTASAPFSALDLGPQDNLVRQRQERYNRAAQTYTSYRDATRYPPTSRPLSEHPDQARPFEPIVSERVLQGGAGKAIKGMHLHTGQDRVFVNGTESVVFTLQAQNDDGAALPLTILRSVAFSLPDAKSSVEMLQTEVPFAAGNSLYTARLIPSRQGFADYAGTIRLTVQVGVGAETGETNFDVVYSPEVPATWLGVREALEAGSLNFYVKAQIAIPGRYVVSTRVYDANGKAFALLQYNDVVSAGVKEFKLQLFGALVRDVNPTFPVRLVDMNGFLLKADTFPDRSMLARQAGIVHTSALYQSDQFSSDEWTSEERQRYLNEYHRDLVNAENELQKP
jgi:hypothetical protein